MNWKKTLTAIGLVSATIVSLGGAATVLDVPRPVFAYELAQLSQEVIELDNIVTSAQLDDNRLRLYDNLREQDRYERSNTEVPKFLLQEQILLERKIDDLDDRLDNIRDHLE